MYLVLKCPYNISYLCCSAIVVIDREEEHDTKHRGWQHGKQVGLKAPNILDGPNTRNAKFLQKQIHHLEQGCTPNSRFNEIKNLRIGLQWQPPLLLCHGFCCNTNYFHWRTLHRYSGVHMYSGHGIRDDRSPNNGTLFNSTSDIEAFQQMATREDIY